MNAKDYYRKYVADDGMIAMNEKLMDLIEEEKPVHALDFGCGSGKHIRALRARNISAFGIDVSPMNVIKCIGNHDGVGLFDETYLRHFCNADIVFTVSVMDHIPEIDGIIGEFKRIANKSIFLLETTDIIDEYYFAHDYSKYGFELLPYGWLSSGDGATYHIYKWMKGNDSKEFIPYDDEAM